MPVGVKLAEGSKRAMAGQAVRLLEIPADAGKGFGLFDTLHGFASGDALARHLKAAVERHAGHAGRAFVAALTANASQACEWAQQARNGYVAAWTPAGADGQVQRAAGRFALLAAAGELAIAMGILPWPAGEAERGIRRCFQDWLAQRGGIGSAEERDGLRQVRLFLEQHGASRFEAAWQHAVTIGDAPPVPSAERTINRAGFRRVDQNGRWTWYVLPEVCKGFDPTMVAKALAERRWLVKGEGTKLQRKIAVPGQGKPRLYEIAPAFLEGEDD